MSVGFRTVVAGVLIATSLLVAPRTSQALDQSDAVWSSAHADHRGTPRLLFPAGF